MAFDLTSDGCFSCHIDELPPPFAPSPEDSQRDTCNEIINSHKVPADIPLLRRLFGRGTSQTNKRPAKPTPHLIEASTMPSPFFNDDSERGFDPPKTNTLQTGYWDEVLPEPHKLRSRVVWLLESVSHYRELDIARNYTFVVPRGLNGRPIVQGKTNCPEGLAVIYEEANKYFIESWTGRQRRLVVKFRKAPPKACHPRLPTPKVERNAAMRIEKLSAHERMAYELGVSTVGIRDQWQIFKEDVKPKMGHFDLMPYRIKYFGDLDMDLKDGLVVDIGYCECNWATHEQGRVLELVSAGKKLVEACRDVGSSLRPQCWGCQSLYEVQEMVRRL